MTQTKDEENSFGTVKAPVRLIYSIQENDLHGRVSFAFVGSSHQALRGANLGALTLHCHLTIPW